MKLAVIVSLSIVLSYSASAQDTVHVKAGWNIIGSVKPGAVPDVLSTDPPNLISTAFFGYEPGTGYQSTDTLDKGFGYWVKVSADGAIIFDASSPAECGIMRVDYGGISYGTVQIGDQCWLAENLNVGTILTRSPNQADNGTLEKHCYAGDSVFCGVYGGWYQWNEAMQYDTTEGGQGICPSGWHIPTYAEFQILSATVSADGNALKEGTVGFRPNGVGTNTSGFSALLAGYTMADGDGEPIGNMTAFWSSTQYDGWVKTLILHPEHGLIEYWNEDKDSACSVRCLED